MSHFPVLQLAAMEKFAASPDGLLACDLTCLFPGGTDHGRRSRAAELVHALRCKGYLRESGRRTPEGGRYPVRVWAATTAGLAWRQFVWRSRAETEIKREPLPPSP